MFVIDPDCYGTIAVLWAFAIAVIALVCWLVRPKAARALLIVAAAVFMGFVTWFHRVPERDCPGGDRVVTAVADGKVIIVEQAYEGEFLKRDCWKVSVYMDFFDVHANFWPMTGTVSHYCYHPGRYLLAFYPKSSDLNEHATTVVRNASGQEVLFKQIAGTFARRIVCYSEEGMPVSAGEQCGIIKFGSRIDFYLPLEADVKVRVGDKVRACESVIALL